MAEARAAITKLESLAVSPGEFNHRAHVRMAWNYLRLCPVHEALGRFSAALKAFATSAGAPKKYHETVTWGLILVVNQRMTESGLNSSGSAEREESPEADLTWQSFAEANPDLFVWPGGPLSRYYSPELLSSDRARLTFVMPDLITKRS